MVKMGHERGRKEFAHEGAQRHKRGMGDGKWQIERGSEGTSTVVGECGFHGVEEVLGGELVVREA